jgi:capsule polysaccharide export protein KpsE/RkpR
MSKAISSILKQISKTTFAAGLAFGLLAGAHVAAADEATVQQRAEAAMMQGKDYASAGAEATRSFGPSSSRELATRITRSESQMNQGLDYVAARDAASRAGSEVQAAPEQVAKAQRAEDEMNEGKDYVAARDANDRSQPRAVVSAKPTLVGQARAAK